MLGSRLQAATGSANRRSHSHGNEIRELSTLHSDLLELEIEGMAQATNIHASYQQSARNLLHYLALRRHDIRQLQDRLAALGLSSLGRLEPHVRATVEALLGVLHRLGHRGRYAPPRREPPVGFAEGKDLLRRHTDALLGPEPVGRAVRIMVTIPREAAHDPALALALLESGMDCARINCAHDDAEAWGRMIAYLRTAERELGKSCRVLMDLAGPKLRDCGLYSGSMTRAASKRFTCTSVLGTHSMIRSRPSWAKKSATLLSGTLLAMARW